MLHSYMFLCLLSQQIPNNTVYRWEVINDSDGVVIENLNNNEKTFYTTFTSPGTYEIIVQIWNYQMLLLNATTTIIITES